MFYKDSKKETGNYLFSTSIVSTTIICVYIITIHLYLEFIGVVRQIPNKYYIIFFMILVWFFNYYFIVKKEKFLNYNFKKDKKGTFVIIIFFILTALFSISIANKNREKIFKERLELRER